MDSEKRWTFGPVSNGIQDVSLSSWRYFSDFICDELIDHAKLIFRGHAVSEWKLESSLERILKGIGKNNNRDIQSQHLRNFQYSARGRRGSSPQQINDESEWWALGQHHGLATPLLDWTESPFVALYFAFIEETDQENECRVIYTLAEDLINMKVSYIKTIYRLDYLDWRQSNLDDPAVRLFPETPPQEKVIFLTINPKVPPPDIPDVPEIIRPLSQDNPRLVNQRGLFVRCPITVSLEEWIAEHFRGETRAILLRICIPDKEREGCLRLLNRMNINHLSLFPDLFGSSFYCNTDLKTENY